MLRVAFQRESLLFRDAPGKHRSLHREIAVPWTPDYQGNLSKVIYKGNVTGYYFSPLNAGLRTSSFGVPVRRKFFALA
jgi:hypothetical protein